MSKTEIMIGGALLIFAAYAMGRQRGYATGMADQQSASIGGGLGWLSGWTLT